MQGDGWGAFELAARYDWLDMNTDNINGGALDIGTLGFNWYLTPRIRMMTDWVHVFATNTGQALAASSNGCGFPAQGKSATIGCFNGLTPNMWQTAVRIDF
jgi:phosphate-selective porin OprO/OprP